MIEIIFYAFTAVYAVYGSNKYKNWVINHYYDLNICGEAQEASPPQLSHDEHIRGIDHYARRNWPKNSLDRNKIFNKLMEKIDVLNFLKFSQKASIIYQALNLKSFSETLAPQVYLNQSRKKIKGKKGQKTKNDHKGMSKGDISVAYQSLIQSAPKTQLELQIKNLILETIEKSGKIDQGLVVRMRNLSHTKEAAEEPHELHNPSEEKEKEKRFSKDQLDSFRQNRRNSPLILVRRQSRLQPKMAILGHREAGSSKNIRVSKGGFKSRKNIKSRFVNKQAPNK